MATLDELVQRALLDEELKRQADAETTRQRQAIIQEFFEQAMAEQLPHIFPLLEHRRTGYDEETNHAYIVFTWKEHEFLIGWKYGSLAVTWILSSSTVHYEIFADSYHTQPAQAERAFALGLGKLMAQSQLAPHELARLPAPTSDEDGHDDDEPTSLIHELDELYEAALLAFFAPPGWRAYAAAEHLHSVLRSVYGDLYEDRGAFTHWDPMHGPSDDQYREIAQRHGLPTDDGEVA